MIKMLVTHDTNDSFSQNYIIFMRKLSIFIMQTPKQKVFSLNELVYLIILTEQTYKQIKYQRLLERMFPDTLF